MCRHDDRCVAVKAAGSGSGMRVSKGKTLTAAVLASGAVTGTRSTTLTPPARVEPLQGPPLLASQVDARGAAALLTLDDPSGSRASPNAPQGYVALTTQMVSPRTELHVHLFAMVAQGTTQDIWEVQGVLRQAPAEGSAQQRALGEVVFDPHTSLPSSPSALVGAAVMVADEDYLAGIVTHVDVTEAGVVILVLPARSARAAAPFDDPVELLRSNAIPVPQADFETDSLAFT